jgi:hypothetical protein
MKINVARACIAAVPLHSCEKPRSRDGFAVRLFAKTSGQIEQLIKTLSDDDLQRRR